MKKRLILSSIATIALFSSLVIGGTYALFTSESTTNINVSSGKVNYTTDITNIKTFSFGKEQENNMFENGGSVSFDSKTNTFAVSNITPGDKVTFDFNIRNNSNVKTAYRIKVVQTGSNFIIRDLVIGGIKESATGWEFFDIPGSDEERVVTKSMSIEMKENAQNNAQGRECAFKIQLSAWQSNKLSLDDVAPLEVDDVNKVVNIKGYNSFYEFVNLTNEWDANWTQEEIDKRQYKGYTVNLLKDIDLFENTFDTFKPIGKLNDAQAKSSGLNFAGTFDGHGHTIYNMKYSAVRGYGYGLFNTLLDGASVKNVNIENVSLQSKLYSGAITGLVKGNALIENCHVKGDINITAENYAGGIVGYGASNIISSTVNGNKGSLVSTKNTYAGGIFGFGGPGANIYKDLEANIDVSALTFVGGIGGNLYYGNTVDNCHAKGTIHQTYNGDPAQDSYEYGIGGIMGIHIYKEGETNVATIKNSSFEGTLVNDFNLETDWTTVHDGIIGLGHHSSGDIKLENLNLENNKIVIR